MPDLQAERRNFLARTKTQASVLYCIHTQLIVRWWVIIGNRLSGSCLWFCKSTIYSGPVYALHWFELQGTWGELCCSFSCSYHMQYPIYQRIGTTVISFRCRLLYTASPVKLTRSVSSFPINCQMSSKTALNGLLLSLHIHPWLRK